MLKLITIQKNDAGQRIDKFLYKSFPRLSASIVCKAVRQKDIRINGKRCEISTKLCENDEVRLFLPEQYLEPKPVVYDFLKSSKNLDVIYEDENILIVNKPAGLLVHSDSKEYGDTVIGRVQRYLYEKKEFDPANENSFVPALVNRIDRNTMGLVIAAKNADALRVLNKKIRDREIQKYYLCVVVGTLERKHDILIGSLSKDESSNKVTVCKDDGLDKQIKTEYQVLGSTDDLSLLEIQLHTGRTHQIRAHLASIGHPLLGDGKYGSDVMNKRYGITNRQLLCAYRLVFSFLTDAGCLSYLNNKEFRVPKVEFVKNGTISL